MQLTNCRRIKNNKKILCFLLQSYFRLHLKYEGTLIWNNKTFALDNDKMLLRGCILRNTKWIFGVVIFAGRDTKLMQNSGKTIFKRTSLDRLLNLLILGIVLVLLSMCLFCTIACGIWETVTGSNFQMFLPWDAAAVPNSDDKLAGNLNQTNYKLYKVIKLIFSFA